MFHNVRRSKIEKVIFFPDLSPIFQRNFKSPAGANSVNSLKGLVRRIHRARGRRARGGIVVRIDCDDLVGGLGSCMRRQMRTAALPHLFERTCVGHGSCNFFPFRRSMALLPTTSPGGLNVGEGRDRPNQPILTTLYTVGLI